MYPEEYKLNIINRKLVSSLRAESSEEPDKSITEVKEQPEVIDLHFLKFLKAL